MSSFDDGRIQILLFLLVAWLLYYYMILHRDTRVTVVARTDGRVYKVRDVKNKQETAETLARLNTRIMAFLQRLLNDIKVPNGDPEQNEINEIILRLQRRYDPNALSEGTIDPALTSYTLNKGEQVVFCMRTRDGSDALYDDNILFYVALHELAHIASVTEHHNHEFRKNFKFLLDKASEWKLYTRVTTSFNYCGLQIPTM